MMQAQVEQFVYNAPSPWWTVGTGLGAAVLAGVFATAGWYVIHRTSRSRDLENWRRTTVTKAVSELIEESTSHFREKQRILRKPYPRNESLRDTLAKMVKSLSNMESRLQTLKICGAFPLHDEAEKIIRFNKFDNGPLVDFVYFYTTSPYPSETDIDSMADDHRSDENELEVLHLSLISKTQEEMGIVKTSTYRNIFRNNRLK